MQNRPAFAPVFFMKRKDENNMKNKELVSIIVPVYNAEKFIKDTINTVLQQTHQNFELILVDDCSNDASIQLIQQEKDKRIQLIKNKKNSGAAISRNNGIKIRRLR